MPTTLGTQGSDPFDKQFTYEVPIALVWQASEEFGQFSPLQGRRYHKNTHTVLDAEIGVRDLETAQALIDTTQEHFVQLQKLGMHIVSRANEVSSAAEAEVEVDADFVLVNAAKYIAACRPLQKSRDRKQTPVTYIHADILKPLGSYLQWVREAQPDCILANIYQPNRYAWQESTETIFLHHIKPQLTPNRLGAPDELAMEAIKAFQSIAPAAAVYL